MTTHTKELFEMFSFDRVIFSQVTPRVAQLGRYTKSRYQLNETIWHRVAKTKIYKEQTVSLYVDARKREVPGTWQADTTLL